MGRRKTAIEIQALAGRRWSNEDARAVLRVQERSGLSIHAFARGHELSPERLYRWKRRLGPSSETCKDELAEIEFAPVVVTSTRAAAPVTVRIDEVELEEVELEVADPTAVEPRWLAAVVAELRGR